MVDHLPEKTNYQPRTRRVRLVDQRCPLKNLARLILRELSVPFRYRPAQEVSKKLVPGHELGGSFGCSRRIGRRSQYRQLRRVLKEYVNRRTGSLRVFAQI